jgi:hypothetical protein
MAVSIAEYLGQRVDREEQILPAIITDLCPFMNAVCSKLKEGNKPVCSVRKTNGDVWIVCKHRLCSTIKSIPLNPYQRGVLLTVAKTIWGDLNPSNVLMKREIRIPLLNGGYNADYILVNNTPDFNTNGPKKIILEMQGGGETSNTGHITKIAQAWEANPERNNNLLSTVAKTAGTIETNAWRRQQEQFIIKGNIASQTGGAIVFCVGKLLYEYLSKRIEGRNLNNLKNSNWTLALLCFNESQNQESTSITFEIDSERQLFTSYLHFVQALINQGQPFPEMFTGQFENLIGESVSVSPI